MSLVNMFSLEYSVLVSIKYNELYSEYSACSNVECIQPQIYIYLGSSIETAIYCIICLAHL